MSQRCDECRRRVSGAGRRTATRVLCEDCFTRFSGLAAGYMATGTAGGAISTSGWHDRIKKAIRREG